MASSSSFMLLVFVLTSHCISPTISHADVAFWNKLQSLVLFYIRCHIFNSVLATIGYRPTVVPGNMLPNLLGLPPVFSPSEYPRACKGKVIYKLQAPNFERIYVGPVVFSHANKFFFPLPFKGTRIPLHSTPVSY